MIPVARKKMKRRHSQRYPFIRIVDYDKGGSFQKAVPRLNEKKVAVVNVSQDGVCLLLEKSLEPATVIKIALPIGVVNVTTPTLAEVMWVKRTPWGKSHFAGCRFLI